MEEIKEKELKEALKQVRELLYCMLPCDDYMATKYGYEALEIIMKAIDED